MSNFNKVILLGRLTRNPELSYLPSQTAVCSAGVVVNEKRKQQDGSYKEIPCFVDCVCFGKRGEAINKYLKKGDPIHISGKLQFESWDAKDGTKRNKLKVFIEDFQFVGQGNQNGQQDSKPAQQQGGYNAPPQNNAPEGSFEQKNNIPPDEDTPVDWNF